MLKEVSAVALLVIAVVWSATGFAEGGRVPAAELEKNAVAYKGQRLSLDNVYCAYVRGAYVCFHRAAKLFVATRARPVAYQEYLERGCGTTSSKPDRCIIAISFDVRDVKWEAQPGQVRTMIVATSMEFVSERSDTDEQSMQATDGPLPIRANDFAEVFNALADSKGVVDLRASPTACERTTRSTLCRYRIGEHSVLTMVSAGEALRANELALTSSADTLARQQMVAATMQLIIEMIAPAEYPEVKSEALRALVQKASNARERPRSPQLVTQPLGKFELSLYEDLQGQLNFNVRKR